MSLSMNPKKAFRAVNSMTKATYLSIALEALFFLVYAVSGGSIFGGHWSVFPRVLGVFGAYLILDNGLAYLRGKTKFPIALALIFNSLFIWLYLKHASQTLDKVALVSALVSTVLLLLPASRKHLAKTPPKIVS